MKTAKTYHGEDLGGQGSEKNREKDEVELNAHVANDLMRLRGV
jgi:hypothetical protein